MSLVYKMYIIRTTDAAHIADNIQELAEQVVYSAEEMEVVEGEAELLRLPTPALPKLAMHTLYKLLDTKMVCRDLTRRWSNTNEKYRESL